MTDAYRPPDWLPLERALAEHFGEAASTVAPSFWFIGFVPGPADVGKLRLYEHCLTHRRVALDRLGRAFCWYEEIGAYGRAASGVAWVEALS